MNDEATALIQALCVPSAFPHPVDQIEVLETHISWVLLAGEFAYKVKKPLRLNFLDFSTLEKRHFYCQEELRLNRRLAERIYLAVVPICGPRTAPVVNGAGKPIEWAVQMRRFPQEAILSQRLADLAPGSPHIDQLARQAAEFHARIAVAPPDSPWGSYANVSQPIEENFDEILASTSADHPLRERLTDLRRWNRTKLDQLQHVLENRKRDGFIRECHGDMHLGNIVLLPAGEFTNGNGEAIVIFDGIEFNENFRWIDVQNEIAFPVMDFDQRRRPELAWQFLNAYLELSGDYRGLEVLPLYLNYRALVRAKVDWIRGAQTGLGEVEHQRLQAEFARYLSLAERYARPPHPRLILTHGVSGSGKSYFTRRLAHKFGAVRIRSDVERKRLHASFVGDPEKLYSAAATRATYQHLERLAGAAIGAGFSVILDAAFLSRARRDQFRNLAEQLRVPCTILDFQASLPTLRRRIVERAEAGHDPSDAGLAVLANQFASREPLDAGEQALAIVVDTESPQAFHILERQFLLP